jgi:nitroreductase
MDLKETILGRRSIRRFRSEPIPEALVREILELARHAPSSMNGQPWEFIIVDDHATLTELGAIKDYYCPPAKREFKAEMFTSAPLAIVVCVDTQKSYERDIENGVLATANLMLAAHSLGLGSVYLSAQTAREPRLAQSIRELLRIPEGIAPITIIPLGYPDETPPHKDLQPIRVINGAYNKITSDKPTPDGMP